MNSRVETDVGETNEKDAPGDLVTPYSNNFVYEKLRHWHGNEYTASNSQRHDASSSVALTVSVIPTSQLTGHLLVLHDAVGWCFW